MPLQRDEFTLVAAKMTALSVAAYGGKVWPVNSNDLNDDFRRSAERFILVAALLAKA